jgi:hypothetical protein
MPRTLLISEFYANSVGVKPSLTATDVITAEAPIAEILGF